MLDMTKETLNLKFIVDSHDIIGVNFYFIWKFVCFFIGAADKCITTAVELLKFYDLLIVTYHYYASCFVFRTIKSGMKYTVYIFGTHRLSINHFFQCEFYSQTMITTGMANESFEMTKPLSEK